MKKSKFITFVLIVVAICTTISLTGCANGKEHTWATEWSSDNTYHWHKCTSCNEVKDKAKHKYVSNKCVCGKVAVLQDEVTAEDGVVYTLSEDKTAYIVSAITESAKSSLTILPDINGVPVTTIAETVFYGVENLTNISIPDSISVIEYLAFGECADLKFNEYEGGLYLGNSSNKYHAIIKAKDDSVTSITTHSDCKVIADYAFYNNFNLTEVTISNNIKSISDGAFMTAIGLNKVTLPNTLAEIGEKAFQGTAITELVIPDSVTEIGANAFTQCKQLTSIKLPANLKEIKYYTFGACNNLTKIVIPDNVTIIGEKAFNACMKLIEIVIPKSVKSIGSRAFYLVSTLEKINFKGSEEEWAAIEKGEEWNEWCSKLEVVFDYQE